jgi:hypothetical protein
MMWEAGVILSRALKQEKFYLPGGMSFLTIKKLN